MKATEMDEKAAILHEKQLRATLTELLNDAKVADQGDIRSKLLDLEKATSGFKEYLSLTVPIHVYNEMRSQHSGLAALVFGTPELLELILAEVGPIDVLNAHQVCRNMRDSIEASSPLQMKLFARPAPEILKHHPLVDHDNH